MGGAAVGEASAHMMRQALVEPGAVVSIERVPVPVPGAGEARVRSLLVGICGSDTHALAGTHPFLNAPYIAGHEVVGVVDALGEAVTDLRVGQRVILKPNVACGRCDNCKAGRSNACATLSWIGCDPSRVLSGGMADYFVAPGRNLFLVPDAVDDATAALVECLGTPVHAARITGDLRGSRVVVLGAGTIGALCVVAARRAGAGVVVVTDLDHGKLDRAVRIGAHAGVIATAPDVREQVVTALGGEADVVFDCVANERSIASAVDMLRRAGTLLLVGVPPRDALVPLPLVQDWELRIQGCAAYTEQDIELAIDIAAAGGIPTTELTKATFALDDAAEAFALAARDASGKVFVSPALSTAMGDD